jgi:hypothetical protein
MIQPIGPLTTATRVRSASAGTAHVRRSGHVLHPYGYVDWSVRAGHGLTKEMGELIADAASALKAGPEEMLPRMGPWRHGVVFNRGQSSSAAKESPDGDPVVRVHAACDEPWLRERA